jgi:transposase
MTFGDITSIPRPELEEECRRLLHRVAWLEKQVFGPKSERNDVDENQTCLDLGVEPASEPTPARSITIAAHDRRVSRKPTADIPGDLPVFSEETLLPDVDVSRCDIIGEEVTRKLERIPAKIGWHLIHRPKLRDRDNGEIFIAELPPHCNPKGLAGTSVIANVYTNKFQFHQPLYRQSQSIRQETFVSFAESTLVDMVSTADSWLSGIAHRIEQIVLEQSYIQADESRIPVLTKGKHGKVHSGFEWVMYSPQMKAAVFRYEPGRAQKYADTIFAQFKGRLQTDDYDGYNGVRRREGITAAACMAHARRYYLKAIDHPKYADTAVALIKELYAVEDEARSRELDFEARRLLRQEKSVPVMARFKAFLHENRPAMTPSSGIAKAFDYTLNNWNELSVFLNDGEVEIDNNLIENAIRPLALGRKNWMFAGSANGAKWASTAYTIIATAKLHGLDPYAYIHQLLRKLPGMNSNEIDQLLPWNMKNW